MVERREVPRGPRRELTDTDVEVEVAGIRAGLEMGGLPFTDLAEQTSRAVLTGEMSGDDAIAAGLAELDRRLAQ